MVATPQPPLFIHPLDLLKIYPKEISATSSVYYKYKIIKKMLGKQKHQHITIKELAEWEGVPVEEIQNILK